ISRSSLESLHVIFTIFFFFQAEDGIRDATVTGVQTCALPISEANIHPTISARGCKFCLQCLRSGRRGNAVQRHIHERGHAAGRRSEERRVGKEWSSPCWRYG